MHQFFLLINLATMKQEACAFDREELEEYIRLAIEQDKPADFFIMEVTCPLSHDGITIG